MHKVTLFFLLYFVSGLTLADDSYQQLLNHRQEFAELAAGATGFYAIQDMHELEPGQTIYLPKTSDLTESGWLEQAPENVFASVTYKDEKVIIESEGIPGTDLLKAENRQLKLPNGLFVRVSFLHAKTIKVWLYNPELPKIRKFAGLDYFPFDANAVLKGQFVAKTEPEAVNYLDSRDQQGIMYRVGKVNATIENKRYTLDALSYQNDWKNINGAFVLLRDKTSGKSSYGGGRVVDVELTQGKDTRSVIMDLNRSYSFLCAHSNFYNCPLILTNYIDAELHYGEKYPPLRAE